MKVFLTAERWEHPVTGVVSYRGVAKDEGGNLIKRGVGFYDDPETAVSAIRGLLNRAVRR